MDQLDTASSFQTFFRVAETHLGITLIDKAYSDCSFITNSHLNTFSLQVIHQSVILASYTRSLEEMPLFSPTGFLLLPIRIIMSPG